MHMLIANMLLPKYMEDDEQQLVTIVFGNILLIIAVIS